MPRRPATRHGIAKAVAELNPMCKQKPQAEGGQVVTADDRGLPAWRLRSAALPLFDRVQAPLVPVVARKSADTPPELRGALFHVDALKAYNRALATRAAEEHSWVCTDRAGGADHPLSGPLAITV